MIKVLIIEDEEYYGEFLKRIIQKKYNCELARDFGGGKELLNANKYDVVFYDLRLPGGFGKDLVKYVRKEIDPDIINIIVTGYEHDWNPVEATAEDIFYYLRKGSFKPEELLKILDNAVQLRKLKLREGDYLKNLIISERLASMGKLAVSIAHEINNPLQSLTLISDLLKKEIHKIKDNKTVKDDIDLLEKGIERIKDVVKILIDLNKTDYGKIKKVRLTAIVNRAVSFLRPIARERHTKIYINNNYPDKAIFISEDQTFHLLLNIFINILEDNLRSIEVGLNKLDNYAVIEIKTLKQTNDDVSNISHNSDSDNLRIDLSKNIVKYYNGKMDYKKLGGGELITIKIPLNRNKENIFSIQI